MTALVNITEFSSNLPNLSLAEVSNCFDLYATSPTIERSHVLDPNTRRIRVISSSDIQMRIVSDQRPDQDFFQVLGRMPETFDLTPFFGDRIVLEVKESL